jgi:radical SAM superfamily enzyme YgiQ (UPF0313 family)
LKLALVSMRASDSPEALPLGSACVAAAVKSAVGLETIESFIVEALPGEDAAALAARLADSEAELVGFSVYSWSRTFLAQTARALRPMRSGIIVFAGGPEATADPESMIAEAGLDFAVAGEGELSLPAALRALLAGRLEAEAIAGIALPGRPWRAAPPADSAELPSPWLSRVIDPAAFGGDLVWELARGCPFHCAYCYESKGQGGSRPFPMERIEAELDLLVARGARYIFILDPTFDSDPARAASLLDLLGTKPGVRWKFELRAELLDKGIARRLGALDCSVQIGLQSVNRRTLETVGRPGFDRKSFARKIAMLGAQGVSFGLDLIYGLPGDSLSDFEEGIDFALALEPNHLDLFPLALLPGTELEERAAELGIEAEARPPYEVVSTREMGRDDLAEAASLARACDRFYSAGRAVGWFRAALAPLRERPSAFLRGFAASLGRSHAEGGGAELDRRAIEAEQLGYLERRYEEAHAISLLPALRDLVRLHGAWGRALAEGEETVLELRYDPEAALGAAASLAAFARSTRPRPGSWRVIPDPDEGARIERG